MPWKVCNMNEERFKFVMEVQKNERSFSAICQEFGVSRPTGYKWWSRYEEARDPEVLKDLSRAPDRVHKKISYEVEQLIIECRKDHPSWGPDKILARLRKDHPRRKLPTISTGGRVLKRNGLIKEKKRRVKTPPYTQPFSEVTACNQVWCIDFKGHFKTQDGTIVYPLTITDAQSRLILCCQAMRRIDWLEVALIMERVFKTYGLPEAIRSDNGAPFASTGIGGLTKLSVWWAKLGIIHERIEPGHPEQNGRHERMHRTLKNEACKKPATTFQGQKTKFKRFVTEFNNERPHAALSNKTPAEVHVPSMKTYSIKNIEHGFPKFGIDHVFINRNGITEFNGNKIKVGTALVNQFVDVLPNGKSKWAFCFGKIYLGDYNEKLKKFIRIKPIKPKSVNHVMR